MKQFFDPEVQVVWTKIFNKTDLKILYHDETEIRVGNDSVEVKMNFERNYIHAGLIDKKTETEYYLLTVFEVVLGSALYDKCYADFNIQMKEKQNMGEVFKLYFRFYGVMLNDLAHLIFDVNLSWKKKYVALDKERDTLFRYVRSLDPKHPLQVKLRNDDPTWMEDAKKMINKN